MRRTALSLALATTVLVAALGCGGSVDGTGTPTDASTAADRATNVGTSSDAGDSGSADAIAPVACEATSVEAGTGSAGDADVPFDHRPTRACCPGQRGPGPSGQPYPSGVAASCSSDSECVSGVNGRCFPFEGLVGPGGCSYDECFTDSQCGPGATCSCRSSSTDNVANYCVPAGNCVVDSDCGPGGYCSPSLESCAGPSPYYCHTAMDTCMSDRDCPPFDAGGSSCPAIAPCAYDAQEQRWACRQLTCCPP
jgi:hypothetical protein